MVYVEDEIVKIYFKNVSAELILNDRISYNNFPKQEFKELMFCYMKEFSETESDLLHQHMGNFWDGDLQSRFNRHHVFYALKCAVSQMLVVHENEIRCRYAVLQRWRMLSRDIGEDLPICLFLVQKTKESGNVWNNFRWKSNIGHTNAALNRIVSQGVSDNHFHLFGSAPVFELIWLRLMNDVNQKQFAMGLRKIESKKRSPKYQIAGANAETKLEYKVLQAALIRALLYHYMHNGRKIDRHYAWLIQYLTANEEILDVRKEINDLINSLKECAMLRYGTDLLDYAGNGGTENKTFFEGERRLIYQLLVDMLIRCTLPDKIGNLLYAYLVIRTELRAEIIQNNDNLGFENFAVYQGRKGRFLTSRKDMERMIIGAVEDSFESGNMISLEMRITPGMNYLDNARWLIYCDHIITQKTRVSKEQFYYVYHFPKERVCYIRKCEAESIPCRDSVLRKKTKQWGNSIILMREHLPEIAARVYGIDACSQEIGCRPEVFAPLFRRLQNHRCENSYEAVLPQLKQTYHAGEDFLDITDGLRALDEAIHFFNMRNGDRFGHATVLGTSVRNWYAVKHNVIVLPIQDYLDNVVWLYYKILEFRIEGCEQIKDYLLLQFEEYFYQIYAAPCDRDRLNITINTYYEAWKLRGDEPELYRGGVYERKLETLLEPEIVNENYPENQRIRYKKEAAAMYSFYHYNWEVREAGSVSKEIPIPEIYIDAVEKVQREMQKMIGELGISIETNPSSNLAISIMSGYEEHPIFKLYNLGLKSTGATDCPQLCVSINTDDKGVFNSGLENEYALLASTLENLRDHEGKSVHNRQEVYDWINRVRIMGNRQTFRIIGDRGMDFRVDK